MMTPKKEVAELQFPPARLHMFPGSSFLVYVVRVVIDRSPALCEFQSRSRCDVIVA